MSSDILIEAVRQGITEYYDIVKFDMETDCQDVLERERVKRKSTRVTLRKFESLMQQNELILNSALDTFNAFFDNHKETSMLANQNPFDLIQSFIQSTIYIQRIHLRQADKFDPKPTPQYDPLNWGVGALVHFDWFLNEKQLSLIKVLLLKDDYKMNIKLCLDEVSNNKKKKKNFFFFRMGF